MLTQKYQTQDTSLATRLLIACGAIGPILFILAFLVEGAMRPGYSAWHNFVSDLSLSNQGWMQIANFLICGVLVLCFALGLRQVFRSGKGSVWGPLLLGVFGLSLLIAGISFVGIFIACIVTAALDGNGVLLNSPTGLLERISIIATVANGPGSLDEGCNGFLSLVRISEVNCQVQASKSGRTA